MGSCSGSSIGSVYELCSVVSNGRTIPGELVNNSGDCQHQANRSASKRSYRMQDVF